MIHLHILIILKASVLIHDFRLRKYLLKKFNTTSIYFQALNTLVSIKIYLKSLKSVFREYLLAFLILKKE